GELVPMGGGHDLMDSVSHHGAEAITEAAAGNRRCLCSIMEQHHGVRRFRFGLAV
ncbi:MAG: M15 family metallopeptidase, partial [Streptosporangiaceae bacterium]